MSATGQLAAWIATTGAVSATGNAIVKRSVLDWIGCALVGSRTAAADIATAYASEMRSDHEARIIASGRSAATSMAAWANGVLGHIDDFDDSGTHPASYLTPALLAIGEVEGSSGHAVIKAWAVGYEITARLVDAVRPERGWHTTPLFGSLAATAAAASLRGLDPACTRMALGIAASGSSGLMGNFGTMTKAMHPGNAARTAVEATDLAQRGFTASPDILERLYGFVDCFGGSGSNARLLTEDLTDRPTVVEQRPPAIKAWPTCTGNHRALTAILELIAEQPIDPNDITLVEHWGRDVPGSGTLHFSNPRTPLEAKFSLEYNISAALLDRRVDVSTFEAARFERGDIQSFMRKVVRYQDPIMAVHSERTRPGVDIDRVQISMANGHVHKLKLSERRTLAGPEVGEKFRTNGRTALAEDALAEIEKLVAHLEDVADIRELVNWL